jgi:Rod binding domain-containing protein
MDIGSIGSRTVELAPGGDQLKAAGDAAKRVESQKTREAFDSFVGQTFYGQMLKAMRSTVDKPAYFHGGRAEEVFQSQLDEMLSENMSKANAHTFTGPMFAQFQANLNQLPRK